MLVARSADRTGVLYRLARGVTEVLAPAPVAGGLLVLVAWHSSPNAVDALRWAALAVLFAAIVPMVYILAGVRQRRITDRHVGVRHERPRPLLVGVLSVMVGVGLLVVSGAPRELIALEAAMAVGLWSSLLVTLAWKISIHVAVVTGAVVILVLVFGPAALVFFPAVVLVAWARIALLDHSPAQTLAGAALGAVVAASVFSLLRA
jgi:membrane-associated phospholipid phosphatase